MTNIPILVYYNGKWDGNFKYSDYKNKGAVLKSDSNYNNLLEILENILKINQTETTLDIKFKLEDVDEPMQIEDDQSFLFYFELRKSAKEVATYPLCVTANVKNKQVMHNQTSSVATGLHTVPSESSATLQQTVDTDKMEAVTDIVEYGRLLSMKIVHGADIQAYENREYKEHEIISDPSKHDIEVGQIYKDKDTLKTALSHYAIRNNFQYKIEKSCNREYQLVCYVNNCQWGLRAARKSKADLFVIKRMNKIHTYSLEE